MDEKTESRRRFLVNTAYIALCVAIYYVFFRYVIYEIMPFFIALMMALLFNRPVNAISEKLKLPRKGTALVVLLLFYIVLVSVASVGITKALVAVISYISRMPQIYEASIAPAIQRIMQFYSEDLGSLIPGDEIYVEQIFGNIQTSLGDLIRSLSMRLLSFAQGLVVGAPTTLLSSLFCVLSTIFISMDYPNIEYFMLHQFSENGRNIIRDARSYISNSFVKLIGSYIVIMSITMIELMISLSFIGQPDAKLIAFVVALFDVMPALGTGGIMIPWALICLINGNTVKAAELFCIYAFITVVRNILEPKIVGESIGLHPVLMLMSLFLGVRIFGGLGILIMPFTLIVIKKLNDSGRIGLYRSTYYSREEESDTDEQYQSSAF